MVLEPRPTQSLRKSLRIRCKDLRIFSGQFKKAFRGQAVPMLRIDQPRISPGPRSQFEQVSASTQGKDQLGPIDAVVAATTRTNL